MNDDEQYKNWLASLKVGDPVCVIKQHYLEKTYFISKIVNITPKKWIVLEPRNKYFKDGCWQSINRWDSKYEKLIPITNEILQEIEYQKALQFLKALKFNELPKQKVISLYKSITESSNDEVK